MMEQALQRALVVRRVVYTLVETGLYRILDLLALTDGCRTGARRRKKWLLVNR
jgi:hypothetical protein